VKLVSTLVVAADDADVLDAHLRFHLNAGVDLVLVAAQADESAAVLEQYVQDGRIVRASGTAADLARLAVTEHGADWVLPADADEFWWPRGESLKDVLAAIPPRYEVVQGLVRVFLPPTVAGEAFSESMTVRPSLLHSSARGAEPIESALRPLYRALPGAQTAADERRVPLRAWYPIEVLRFPVRGPGPAVDRSGLEDGTLVVDERLRDALRILGPDKPDDAAPLVLTPPGIVDDASYAIECAAVGEVDLAKLERQIRELEGRITWLEERFWPRVMRNVRRVVRR
jgi:hypothetical protein